MTVPSLPWPAHDGDVARRIRDTDWAVASPLGPVAQWPATLRLTLGLMLPADVQIVLFWGPSFVAFYNDTYAPTIGNKHPRALGRPAIESWTELWDDLEPLLQRVRATGDTVSAKDRPFQIERHGFLEDVYFDISYSPVRDEAGDVAGVLCLVSETTERVLATRERQVAEAALEARVRERSRDLDRMWRLSTDVMVVSRLDGTIHAINPAWKTVLGWDGREVIGRVVTDFIHPDDLARSREETARLAEGLTAHRFENRWRHRDGSHRLIAWTAVPEGGFVHGVGRDITAERAAALALHDTEERLRQSQKMEAVGQLTGGIAHDFNNLLQGISGSLEVVRRRIAQGRADETERFVSGAIGATQRAAALTHRLLAFARKQPLDPKPVRANPLVASMEELLRRTLGEQISLATELAPDLWTTLCDANQLENALLNLAINARDAMPGGGRLVITTTNTTDPATGVDHVGIAVTDTGTGMPPEVVARAFEPFFTTKPLGQGTGLGLSMIYGFALQSEGFCKIDSAVERGTTVRLGLPRYLGTHIPEAAPAVPIATPSEHGEVVLVVEDEVVVRALIVDVLIELGYRPIESPDGPAALAVLQGPDRIDLLVTDIGLPGLDGRQLARQARDLRGDLPVLLMTGYAGSAATAHDVLDAGMALITKPFSVDAFAERVQHLAAMRAGDHR